MRASVVGLLLVAALLHAGWNAIAKHIPSRLAASTLIGGVGLVGGLVGVFVLPSPAPGSWPFLVVSACLQTGYLILLTAAYRHGDFSQLYPLARGLAVVQVTLISAVVLGERLSVLQQVGVGVIAGALVLLALTPLHSSGRGRRGVGLAVLTGVCVAGYTVVDGQGVRLSGTPLGYAAVLFLLQGAALPLTCAWLAADRRQLIVELRQYWRPGVLGGLMSLIAYAIVVWAQSMTPLAVVSALRETSVLLAGVVGWFAFGERLSPVRTLLTIAAVGGVVALRLA
jgi:drug/metabolite transporter (DMT)-like permease